MKTILKILFVCGIIVLTAFSCEKNENNPDCIEGIVIGPDKCIKATLINIQNVTGMGREYRKNEVRYDNVVKVPGVFPQGNIYFYYREYNNEKDSHLLQFDTLTLCPAIYPSNVPIIVITNYSQIKCPENYEKK